MRWVQDAATEVALEKSWHRQVQRIWAEQLHTAPAVDVCACRHDDLQALGITDQVVTALTLMREHQRVLVIDDGELITGAPAGRRILRDAQPGGSAPRRGPSSPASPPRPWSRTPAWAERHPKTSA